MKRMDFFAGQGARAAATWLPQAGAASKRPFPDLACSGVAPARTRLRPPSPGRRHSLDYSNDEQRRHAEKDAVSCSDVCEADHYMADLLIVALHARLLACSARRGGYRVNVLDLYNDCDTRAAAVQSRKVAQHGNGFDAATLLAMAQQFWPAPAALIAGAGFEDNLELLTQLARGRVVYGNSAATIAQVKDPQSFFSLLDKLSIPHPHVSLTVPRDMAGWLVKRIGGHGGTHVLPAQRRPPNSDDAAHYFQRRVSGRNCSVLFLADGAKACIIGFNKQYVAQVNGSPYWYAGAINRVKLRPEVREEIARKLDDLVAAFSLRGLNSLDFMANGDSYRVLEVNPRPSATMDLYDADFPDGIFDAHLQACDGRLPDSTPIGKVRTHAVIYAPRTAHLGLHFRFPEWCSDIPEAGSKFPRGAPVCLVHAEGKNVPDVERLIEQRRSALYSGLFAQVA